MSVVVSRNLRCDVPAPDGFACMAESPALATRTVAELRARLRRQGWRHRRGQDICPECERSEARP
jgi:hypothetical protein